jgi:hypothetical protein
MPAVPTMHQVPGRITDPVRAWKLATDDQRAHLVASLLTEIHVDPRRIVAIRHRLALRAYFQELMWMGGDGRRDSNPQNAQYSGGSA